MGATHLRAHGVRDAVDEPAGQLALRVRVRHVGHAAAALVRQRTDQIGRQVGQPTHDALLRRVVLRD